jgi:DUF2889 family protein
MPGDDDLIPLHFRDYAVRAYRAPDGSILIRGTIVDRKDAGLVIEDDPDDITIHHMQVDLHVSFPELVITAVDVAMPVHPHSSCPDIVDDYRKLVGTSITRGYTHRVRELFGGPNGCTHVSALLQAMGPVAFQSLGSMHLALRRLGDRTAGSGVQGAWDGSRAALLDTCHVWADGGELAGFVESGAMPPPPIPIELRMRELGRDPDEWVRDLTR